MTYTGVIIGLLLYMSFYQCTAVTNDTDQVEGKRKVCMRDIGCFEITADFLDSKLRPFNVLPQDKRLMNTQFYLYTRNNPTDKHILIADKPKTLINSPIDVSLPTKFIVHGFLDTQFFGKWQAEMKDELMKREEYNIIIVDWSGGNQLPYMQAVANTRVVGAEIAFLITQLQKYVSLSLKTCHIIGHSLGAHIAGYAGERLNKLNRITALDPAGPYFEGMPISVRIDPTDAEFVDAVHTDSQTIFELGLGMSQLVAHLDFFPNEGRKQPGCDFSTRLISLIEDGLIEGLRQVTSCSHQRAVQLFKSSINSRSCQYVGYQCSNWTEFVNGKCASCSTDNSECAIMGLDADQFQVKDQNKSIQVFLKTHDKWPFCGYQYHVTIRLSATAKDSLKGKIEFGIIDDTEKIKSIKINEKYDELVSNDTLVFVLALPFELNLNNPIDFLWRAEDFFSYEQVTVKNVEISSMNQQDETIQMLYKATYYPETEKAVGEGERVKMYPQGNFMKFLDSIFI